MSDLKAKNIKSIRFKILNVTIPSLFILSTVIGLTGMIIVSRLSHNDSEQIMTGICESEALRLDNKLNIVSHSVNMVYEYAYELIGMSDEEDYVYSREYEEKVKALSLAIAAKTEGVVAVYFRYNPDIVGNGTGGFFWSRDMDSNTFKIEQPTDILAYNATDIEHVGWYYVPRDTGEPLWMTPYLNQNLNIYMISYIIPLYLDSGEFVGVIGMDIDFNTIISKANDIKLYNSGTLALVDLSDHMIYHADSNGNARSEKLSNTLYNHITTINKSSDLLEIGDNDGTTSLICYRKVANGMIMYVNVPSEEINRDRNNLMIIGVFLFVVIFVITAIIIWRVTDSIIRPLSALTDITNQYANGQWSEKYVCQTGDEIQLLSEGVFKMAENTQSYINRIKNIARTDVLTGLSNKTSYMETVDRIKANHHELYSKYAIVVMDLNQLKKANDTYGHEIGDLLIKEAGHFIASVFDHSPVFRIGGDEFVAILTDNDYKHRNRLLSIFENTMNYEIPGTDHLKLSISFGMAEYGKESDDYDELFKIADDRMYARKKQMKMERIN